MHDLREKTAQLIVPRLDGNRLSEEDYFNQVAALVDEGIGGFILFGGREPETPDAVQRLQERSAIPLLITSDVERGLGQQIHGCTMFQNQRAVAEGIDPQDPEDVNLLHEMLAVVREECISAGIHAVFSPVADVNINPHNPIICTRSFGDDPEKVSWFVAEYVKGLQGGSTQNSKLKTQNFLLSCAKHFPGHGDTAVDSHTSLPLITADRDRLEMVELPPFKAAINAGVSMIMVGHLKVPVLEPEPVPATFSKKIVTDLLRKEMGFMGLVVTDALDMGALKAISNEGESAVRALNAGCDILLHPSEPIKVLDSVVKALEDRRLSEERVEDAFKRVMAVKCNISGDRNRKSGLENLHSLEIAGRIARKAVKIRKGKGFNRFERIACFIIDDDGDGSVARPFLNAIKGRVPYFRKVSVVSEIKDDETVFILVFSRVSAWKGSSGLSEDSAECLKKILEKAGRSVIIAFGSPYILDNFDADMLVDAFDPADFMQKAVVDRLLLE